MSVLSQPSPFQSCLYSYNPTPQSPLAPLNLNARLPTPSLFSTCPMSKPKSSPSIALKHAREHPRQRVSTFSRDPQKDRDVRRTAFLRSVKERGRDKRHEARSERIIRSDVLAEQRASEQAFERSAALGALSEQYFDGCNDDTSLVEEIAAQEVLEMEALAAIVESESEQARQSQRDEHDYEMSDYGSEDEEYDALLVEALHEFEKGRAQVGMPTASQNDCSMDMSLG